jgi:DNA polymerase II large subunit
LRYRIFFSIFVNQTIIKKLNKATDPKADHNIKGNRAAKIYIMAGSIESIFPKVIPVIPMIRILQEFSKANGVKLDITSWIAVYHTNQIYQLQAQRLN